MPAILQIELPEELLEDLRRQAAPSGKTPAVLAADYVALQIRYSDNPLLKWAGAVSSNVPDASLRHDEYLGQAIYDEMQGRSEDHDVR